MSNSESYETSEDVKMAQTKSHSDKPSDVEAGRAQVERAFEKQRV